ncbi:PCMD domain-containing protein [Bacteroides sp. UBA939]|uniref:PCMD domain-containing protein n=1 Tax=Bacteroides sp. UBA939 TaxID=1946092 RepID=UPI0025C0F43B|nr:PCMD domain-containing protein [Bacteroides sp. UBA939]
MKIKALISCFFLAFAISACIQDEALNSEAAIDGCTGTDVQLVNINTNDKVVDVYVNNGADLAKIELIFSLPEGAAIRANETKAGDAGSVYNFSDGDHSRAFTVTSEDGKFAPVYKVNLKAPGLPTSYHFENLVTTEEPFHIIYEELNPSNINWQYLQWSSGNPGYKLTFMANGATDYPTVQVDGGHEGKCVKLETKNTGNFGAMVKMYIAAGNLFIGNFDVTKALSGASGALQATTFGFQFYKRPVSLRGYFKYKAGAVYTENGITQSGPKDRFDIYAIMYEAAENSFMLDGTNAKTSDKLVYLAQINEEDAVETDTWTEFRLSFESQNGKTLDEQKLRNGKYKLGIVFSSSIDGGRFKGAVGSTLYIDEVELICEED